MEHPDEAFLSPPNLLVVNTEATHGYGEELHRIPCVQVRMLVCGSSLSAMQLTPWPGLYAQINAGILQGTSFACIDHLLQW